MIFSRMILQHSIKVLVIFYIECYCMCKMTIDFCYGNECQNSWTGWFLRIVAPILSIIQLLVLLSKKC